MHIFNEQLMAGFHFTDADRISLAESKMISAITASTPYSGRPVGVIMVITPAAAEDDATLDVTVLAELASVLDAAEDKTVVVAAIVVDIVLISMVQLLLIMLH